MADFNITQSLFGMNPEVAQQAAELLRQKNEDAFANRLATLDPNQMDRYIAARGGQRLGQGLSDFGRGMMGQDIRDPQVKLASDTQAIMQELQGEGYDPSDTVGIRKEFIKRLAARGYTQQAVQMAQELEAEGLGQAKTQADIVRARAAAAKDIADANAPKATPFDDLVKTGKFTPESLEIYKRTKSPSDLVFSDDDYEKVEFDDGVWMVNKNDPTKRTRLGDIKQDQSTDKYMLTRWKTLSDKALDPKTGKLDWNRLTEAERSEAKAVASSSRVFGKEGARSFFNDLAVDLGVEEQKALAGVLRAEAFDREFTPLSEQFMASPKSRTQIAQFYSALDSAKDKGVAPAMVHNFIKDPEAARYIASAIRYINAILRRESGAAVTADEWQRYSAGYIPMPGDSPEAMAEKKRARTIWPQTEIDAFSPAMKNAYGAASSRKIDMTPGGTPPGAPAAAGGDWKAAGDAARKQSRQAYIAWWRSLTPQQKQEYKAAKGK